MGVAGPNAGGVLIVHSNPSVVFSSGESYCAQAGLSACSSAVASIPWNAGTTSVLHILAAFPDTASPRLKALTFGVMWDENKLAISDHGSCADFEVPDGAWPASGTGTGVSWTTTQTNRLIEVYWIAAEPYEGGEADSTSIALIPHPGQGGAMADDGEPPEVDPVSGYGRFGFGIAGANPCPASGPEQDGMGAEEEGGNSDPPDQGEYEFPGEGDPNEPTGQPTPYVVLWLHPGALEFGGDPWTPLGISQVQSMDGALREALVASGAVNIAPEFPTFARADTLGLDWKGDPVRLADLSGIYRVQYGSAPAAASAASALEGISVVVDSHQQFTEPVATYDDFDPYFYDFPELDEHGCVVFDPADTSLCAEGPQWFLRNDGPGRPPLGPTCRPAVAGEDIRFPDPGDDDILHPVFVGQVDTGLPESHIDLPIVSLTQAQEESLLNRSGFSGELIP